MTVEDKKVFDVATLAEATKLISEAELSLIKICAILQTSFSVLIRNMNHFFHVNPGEDKPEWQQIHEKKYKIFETSKDTRNVLECQSCSYESTVKIDRCPKCKSDRKSVV